MPSRLSSGEGNYPGDVPDDILANSLTVTAFPTLEASTANIATVTVFATRAGEVKNEPVEIRWAFEKIAVE
jgi:hypothetical protein